MRENWSFIDTGFRDGKFNMKFDEHLAMLLGEGKIKPTLRVYGWKPYAISIGYNQDEGIFDRGKLKHAGIDLVRRPTGGRAILHAEELTYSVVIFADERNTLEIYSQISRAIVFGLRVLGANVDIERSQVDFLKIYRDISSIPCFSNSARYEIQFKGRKLVGSAQRRYGDVVLQHGSILIGDYHKRLPEFINPSVLSRSGQSDKDAVKKLVRKLEERTVCLNEILGRDVSFFEVMDAIKIGFEMEFGVKFKEVSNEEILSSWK